MPLRIAFVLILSFISSLATSRAEGVVVRVGGYDFSPFVEKEGTEGIVRDLISKLNSSQKKYHFEFVHTSPNRRFKDFKQRKFDIILFEDEVWSWKHSGIKYQSTGVLAQGDEVPIALKLNRDQSFFETLENKKIKYVLGYHYQFNDMKNGLSMEPKKGFEHGRSYQENLHDLINQKVDITFVNTFYLHRLLKNDRELKEKILVGERPDHSFTLRGIVNPSSPITVSELEKLGVTKGLVSLD